MNTLIRFGLIGGFLLFSLLIIPVLTFAADFKAEDQPNLPAGQTVNDDLYMAGGNVTSAGRVVGDLVAGGGSVLVSGEVTEDVIVGGGNVTILGKVGDDVRVGGGNIVVQGAVTGDVVAGGGQINIAGEGVGGDVAVGGGVITIDAPVKGDLKAGGADIRINSTVSGNVEIEADELVLGPNAVIEGNLSYSAPQEATLENGAVVRGETQYNPRREDARAEAALATFFTLALLAKLLMSLVGAFAVGYFFNRFSREMVATAGMQPLLEIGRGLVVLIVLPIISIIFLMTVIGIPLGIFGLLLFALLALFGSLAAPIVTGSLVHKWIWKPAGYVVDWKTILLGVAVYFLLGLIPFVGWIAKAVFFLLTLGAVINIKWSVLKEWQ